MTDHSVFVLEKLKIAAWQDLEERIQKHLKGEFYNKFLDQAMKQVRQGIIIDAIQNFDGIEITIKLKEEGE